MYTRMQSRHTNSTKYGVYVQYGTQADNLDNPSHTDLGVLDWFCTCKTGARTIGCCAHVACVVWWLGYGRHQPPIVKQDQFKACRDAKAAHLALKAAREAKKNAAQEESRCDDSPASNSLHPKSKTQKWYKKQLPGKKRKATETAGQPEAKRLKQPKSQTAASSAASSSQATATQPAVQPSQQPGKTKRPKSDQPTPKPKRPKPVNAPVCSTTPSSQSAATQPAAKAQEPPEQCKLGQAKPKKPLPKKPQPTSGVTVQVQANCPLTQPATQPSLPPSSPRQIQPTPTKQPNSRSPDKQPNPRLQRSRRKPTKLTYT